MLFLGHVAFTFLIKYALFSSQSLLSFPLLCLNTGYSSLFASEVTNRLSVVDAEDFCVLQNLVYIFYI